MSAFRRPLSNGVQTLADGMARLTADDAQSLVTLAATTVTPDDVRENAVANNGTGLTLYFLSIGRWIGTLAVFFLRAPLSERLVCSRVRIPWMASRSFLPNAVIAVVQALAAVLVVAAVVDIHAAPPPGALIPRLGSMVPTAMRWSALPWRHAHIA